MNDREMLRKLADVILYADLEELPFPALRTAYGDEFVVATCDVYAEARRAGATEIAEAYAETIAQFRVAEALLRLAAGHALPKNVGLADDLAPIYAHLGVDPENTGDYEP